MAQRLEGAFDLAIEERTGCRTDREDLSRDRGDLCADRGDLGADRGYLDSNNPNHPDRAYQAKQAALPPAPKER